MAFLDTAAGTVAGNAASKSGDGKKAGKGGGFKAMPTWEKVAFGVGAVGVVYLGYKWYENRQSSSSTATSTNIGTATGSSTGGGSSGGGGFAGGPGQGQGRPWWTGSQPLTAPTAPAAPVSPSSAPAPAPPAAVAGGTSGSTGSPANSAISTAATPSAAQILANPTANPGATTAYINQQQTMPTSAGGTTPTYTGTPLGPGTLVINTAPATVASTNTANNQAAAAALAAAQTAAATPTTASSGTSAKVTTQGATTKVTENQGSGPKTLSTTPAAGHEGIQKG